MFDMQRYAFGVRLRELMKELDVTDEMLAEWVGVSVYTVRSWKYGGNVDKGYYYPTVDTLIKICDTLRVSADYLLYGKE